MCVCVCVCVCVFAVMRHYSASFGAAIAQQICKNISLITALGFCARACVCVCVCVCVGR